MNIDGPKYTGTLLFDLSPVKNDLYDLAPGAPKGARGEQPGLDKVLVSACTTKAALNDCLPNPMCTPFVQCALACP